MHIVAWTNNKHTPTRLQCHCLLLEIDTLYSGRGQYAGSRARDMHVTEIQNESSWLGWHDRLCCAASNGALRLLLQEKEGFWWRCECKTDKWSHWMYILAQKVSLSRIFARQRLRVATASCNLIDCDLIPSGSVNPPSLGLQWSYTCFFSARGKLDTMMIYICI